MKTSSARQPELDLFSGDPISEGARTAAGLIGFETPIADGGLPADSSGSAPLRLPNFSALGQIYAITTRMAGRLNVANISERETGELLGERQALLDKKLSNQITRQEENRLEYVRWSLDRIEDAKYGETLDLLDEYVKRYERLEIGLQDLREQLIQQLPAARRQVRSRGLDRK
jgi:hypothetical protein